MRDTYFPLFTGQELFKSHGSEGIGSGGVRKLKGRVGSGQDIFKLHRSSWVGSKVFQISWVGSGRVGSGQEVFKTSRVGSGHDDP